MTDNFPKVSPKASHKLKTALGQNNDQIIVKTQQNCM